jgi:transcriptional antiterminator RfaH
VERAVLPGFVEVHPMQSWYAVQTKPRKEQAVLEALGRAGIEAYCPRIRHWRRRRRAKMRVESSLFPGYLFARLAFLEDYARVRWTPGLLRVVTSGGVPVEVSEKMLDEVRAMEKAGNRRGLRPVNLAVGSRVCVTEGPFAGFEGRVAESLSGGERVRILIELFRRQAALDVDEAILQSVAAARSVQ